LKLEEHLFNNYSNLSKDYAIEVRDHYHSILMSFHSKEKDFIKIYKTRKWL